MSERLLVSYRLHGIRETFNYHSHEEYEIYFFHAGSCRYLIHNQIYDLEPGDIILMDGMTLHKPNVSPTSKYVRSFIHFSPKWIKGVLTELDSLYLLATFQKLKNHLIRTKESQDSKELERVIRRLAEVKQAFDMGEPTKETELKVLLIQVLIMVHELGETESLTVPKEKSYKEGHAENITTYIQTNYKEKLTINSIAHSLNLSKSYVSHVFKEITGFTVMEYVMGYRLTQAKYLLEMKPDEALKEIAFASGFESASHFSRYFRDKMGVTAGEYRRKRLTTFVKGELENGKS